MVQIKAHEETSEHVFEALGSSEGGLTSEEAGRRLEEHGKNALPTRKPVTLFSIILHQFKSPLIYVLGVAGLIAFLMGDTTDAGFIAVVLMLNALIGSWQEFRAEKGMKALEKFLHIQTRVYRDGAAETLDAENLVPGDVVVLESGQRVPADLRLISATGLEINESMLTGESLAVAKDARWIPEGPTTVGDRLNMAFAGTTVVKGRLKGVVASTGLNTELGRLADTVMSTAAGKAPLQIRMEKFARMVAIVVVGMAILVGLVGVFFQGYSWADAFMLVVALSVAAIPEGLPVGMTVALSVATSRMAARNVIVRRLEAVEGLGSCTYIATDKTGTLTVNALTVAKLVTPRGRFEVSGEGFVPNGSVSGASLEDEDVRHLALTGLLCNEATLEKDGEEWTHLGDPTDVALHVLAEKLGMNRAEVLARYSKVSEIPFEPEIRYAATFVKGPNGIFSAVKGAPERVLAMCGLGDSEHKDALEEAEFLAKSGYRVIALASGDETFEIGAEPSSLKFLGYVGMIDPLRPGVIEAIAQCHHAGLQVAMVTGDHPETALAIARDMGIAKEGDKALTGLELESKTPEELGALIGNVHVFARVAPEQKLQLVRAAKAAGHLVAVTGDGVNDAPALQEANIGVAMGKDGTDVAREASELVITDDNFASIVGGVEEGRIAYDNIRKVIYLLISTGAAELMLIGLAVFLGTPLPLVPVQILWMNLVTNGIQDVALAFEPGEKGVMNRRPRDPSERIFDRLMIERVIAGAAVMAGVSFGLFYYLLEKGYPEAEARNLVLLMMVFFECVHIGNCRSEYTSAFKLSPFRAPILLAGTTLAFSLHVAAMHIPYLQGVLQTQPVSAEWWLILAGLSLTILVPIEVHKWWLSRSNTSPPVH